jgi:transcriptional regulator CtsR
LIFSIDKWKILAIIVIVKVKESQSQTQKRGDFMNISNIIANMIQEMLEDEGYTEIQRNELAQRIGCVPSQINYVISSRFTPEHGYIVESRRGGGGYIKITRATYDRNSIKMHLINSIGQSINENTCRAHLKNLYESDFIDEKTTKIFLSALTGNAYRDIPREYGDILRASIFKQMILNIL